MKIFYIIIFSIFIAFNYAFCWVNKAGDLQMTCYTNPYNDKEFVITGSIDNAYHYISCTIDLLSNKCVSTMLDLPENSIINRTIINGLKKRIGYLANGKIYIYNYITMEKITLIPTGIDWSNSNNKISFSKDGNLIYVLTKDELRFIVFDAVTGEKKDEVIIDSNPNLFSNVYLNTDREEIALVKNDSLKFWSFSTKYITRIIPFYSNAENVEFHSNGDYIMFVINNNDFIILNSITGTEIFNKIFPLAIFKYEISANMRFLICHNQNNDKQNIYDLKSDTFISNLSVNYLYYIYINSNYTKAICSEAIDFTCHYTNKYPKSNSYYLYNLPELSKITSIPEGLVLDPINIIINDQNNRIAVVGIIDTAHYYSAILNNNEDFIKYIYTQEMPIAFTLNSDYLVCQKSGNLYFYNMDNDSLEKVLKTERKFINQVFFIKKSSDRIVTSNYNFIDVFNYNNLSLILSTDLTALGKEMLVMRCDHNSNFKYYNDTALYSFDAYSGILLRIELINKPLKSLVKSISSDGNHILLSLSFDSLMVYDLQLQKIIYSYKIKDYYHSQNSITEGFIGDYTLIWYALSTSGLESRTNAYVYDFEKGQKVDVPYFSGLKVSRDGLYYATIDCPNIYSFQPIPKEVSVKDDLIPISNSHVYPNPASDYIFIQPSEDSIIQIYDMLGVKLSPAGGGIKGGGKIDISNLSPGIYFIKIGNRIEKFVKI